MTEAHDDRYYMSCALAEAQKAFDQGEVPIGAVLVKDDVVIAAAHNMRETWRDATAHAEMLVIRQACAKLARWRLTGTVLYVTIEPCPMCAGAIVQSRIDRLVYGAADPKAGAVISLFNILQHPVLNHQVAVTGGVLADESAALIQRFFRARRSNAEKTRPGM